MVSDSSQRWVVERTSRRASRWTPSSVASRQRAEQRDELLAGRRRVEGRCAIREVDPKNLLRDTLRPYCHAMERKSVEGFAPFGNGRRGTSHGDLNAGPTPCRGQADGLTHDYSGLAQLAERVAPSCTTTTGRGRSTHMPRRAATSGRSSLLESSRTCSFTRPQ